MLEAADRATAICYGPEEGDVKRYRCPCCGVESDCLEAFAMSTCWLCVEGNLDCHRCLDRGVPVNHFRGQRAKMHRMDYWSADRSHIWCECGEIILADNIGQATAVITDYCRKCWPPESDTTSNGRTPEAES